MFIRVEQTTGNIVLGMVYGVNRKAQKGNPLWPIDIKNRNALQFPMSFHCLEWQIMLIISQWKNAINIGCVVDSSHDYIYD